MKLKTKLALEYSDDLFDSPVHIAYLAGFEKCREMAKQDIKEWVEVTGVFSKGESYYHELIDGIHDIGEEEVE